MTRSLAVLRQRAGKKVPPDLQRLSCGRSADCRVSDADGVFEHRTGDLEPLDDPLVRQTIRDCLQEVMDYSRWMEILRDIEAGNIELLARETREPLPFSHQLVNANVYTFLVRCAD